MAFAMAFTMMATAGAAYTDQADIEATEAVEMLNALGVMTGDPDGAFRPNDTITRAEACRMIYSIRTNSDDASAYANMQTTFTDVPADAWYAGYVKHCQSVGIVSGRSETTFDPNADVTGVELALMCLRVMGYDPAIANIGGSTWSTTTIGLATENGLLEDVTTGITSSCPRQYAAQIMYNMILASTVRWSDDAGKYNNTNYLGEKYETVGEKYLKLYIAVGTLVSVDTKNLTISQSDSDVQDTDKAVRGMTGFTNLPNDYSDLLGQKVKVLIRDQKSNDVIGVYPNGDSIVYSVNAVDVSKDDNKVKFEGSSYSVEYFGNDSNKTINDTATGDAIATYIDGQTANGTTLNELDNNELNPNQYTFVDTDGNGKIDTLVVKTFNVAKVTYAAADRIIANGQTYRFADENIADDIAKDDWIVITQNLYNDNLDIVKAEVETGKLNGLRADRDVTPYFDGKTIASAVDTYNEYQIGDVWYNGGEDLVQSSMSENDLNAVKAGEDVDYVAVNGILFYAKKSTGSAVGRVADVALVVAKNNNNLGDEVKIALFDGTTDTVKVDSNSTVKFADLTPGTVYEYNVSGGKYRFENLKSGTNDEKFEEYYGDLTYRTGSNNSQLTEIAFEPSAASNYTTFDSKTIDDDAQILLYKAEQGTAGTVGYVAADVKKITGKQFKSMASSNVASGNVYAFSGDMNGLDRIGALAVQVNNFNNLGNTWTNYGYIIDTAVKTGSNTITYTIWTTDGYIDVQEEKSNISDRAKGSVIGYDTLKVVDGVNVIDDVEFLNATTDNDGKITFTAITGVNSKKTTAEFAVVPVGAAKASLDVAGTILYIDSDAANVRETGVENGEIREAQKDGNSYLANALVIGSGEDIELLIVDQGEYLKSDVYKNSIATGGHVTSGEDASAKTITADATFPNATVGTNYSQTVDFTAKNISNGQTATVKVTSPVAGLSVSAANVSNGKIAVAVSGKPTAAGTLKFTVSADGVTSSEVTVTVEMNTTLTGTPNVADIQNAFDIADEVTVNGVVPAGTINVAANKTLVLHNAQLNNTTTITGTGNVEITGSNVLSDKLTIQDNTKITITGTLDAASQNGALVLNNGELVIDKGALAKFSKFDQDGTNAAGELSANASFNLDNQTGGLKVNAGGSLQVGSLTIGGSSDNLALTSGYAVIRTYGSNIIDARLYGNATVNGSLTLAASDTALSQIGIKGGYTLTVPANSALTLSSSSTNLRIDTNAVLSIEKNGSLINDATTKLWVNDGQTGTIRLAEGAKVTPGATGVFTDDQIPVTTTTAITVGAEDAAASATGLSAGDYVCIASGAAASTFTKAAATE